VFCASVRSLAASRLGALEVAPSTAIQRHRISAQGVASGSLQQETPLGTSAMDMNTKTTVTKPANETYEKMSAATTEAADVIKNTYSTAVKGAQDYNNKLIEFTQANTNAAYDFVQKLSGVKSPSVFVELSTEHARKQFETLTEQSKQLAALAQKVMLATAEPLKTGVAKAQKP
jgi:phasin